MLVVFKAIGVVRESGVDAEGKIKHLYDQFSKWYDSCFKKKVCHVEVGMTLGCGPFKKARTSRKCQIEAEV